MAYTLFTYPLAYNPMKARLALAEKGLPVKLELVDLFNGASLAPGFIRTNPAGTVPVLKTPDGRTITDSRAIVEYVNALEPGPLGGSEADQTLAAAWVGKLCAWDGNLFLAGASDPGAASLLGKLSDFKIKFAEARARENPDLADTYRRKVEGIRAAGAEAGDAAAVAANVKQLESLLDEAEVQLGKTTWLAGPAYSIADVCFTPLLFRLGMASQTSRFLGPRPAVSAYYRRAKERPSFEPAFGAASSKLTLARLLVPALLRAQFAALTGWY